MNHLQHINEFKKTIAEYRPSQDVIDLANNCNLLMFAGVTSSGRNTIIGRLIEMGGFHNIVSDTTREPRVNNGVEEISGVEYFFKSEEDFLQRLKEGQYLEAAIIHNQQVSGISIEELELLAGTDQFGVTDMENEGTKRVLNLAPKAVAVFLIPPSFDEWTKRITKRGELEQEEIRRRLNSAEKELEEALEDGRFKIVINDFENVATEEVANIAHGQKRSEADENNAKQAAWKLLNQLKQSIHS